MTPPSPSRHGSPRSGRRAALGLLGGAAALLCVLAGAFFWIVKSFLSEPEPPIAIQNLPVNEPPAATTAPAPQQPNNSAVAPANPNAATQPHDLRLARDNWPQYVDSAARRMKNLSICIYNFADDHAERLPPDFGSLLVEPKLTPRGLAGLCLTPGDERKLNIPDKPTADWINQNTSYVYLASDVDRVKMVDSAHNTQAGVWGDTVMYHTRLDQPFSDPKLGDVVILAYVDGHLQLQTIAKARRIIAASKKTLDAGR